VSAGLIFVFPRVWCIVSFLTTALITSDSRSALLFIVVAVYEIYHGEGKWGHWGQLREIDFFLYYKTSINCRRNPQSAPQRCVCVVESKVYGREHEPLSSIYEHTYFSPGIAVVVQDLPWWGASEKTLKHEP
jgi:hypothetical protein